MTGKRIIPSAGTLLVVLFLTLVTSCNKSGDRSFQDEVYDKSPEDLVRHSEEFRKEIISVGENIYVASGYGLANSILIEGTDGLIIIDAMESMQKGEEVIREFRKISPEIAQKPVKAIIYTHNHTDHVFGAQAMAREDDPMVIAHELMPYYLDRIATVIRPIIEKRSYRMFGNLLEEEELINCGIGPRLSFDANTKLGVIRPDVVFRDSLKMTIAGIELEMYNAPGETPDQLFVWMPTSKILFCGDNLYKTFPNLYTIRGTAYRDVNLWKESLDKMRRKHPEILVPSHTRPLNGSDFVYSTLTDYRDAIQFIHDQTVRYMNLGFTPDEIVEKVNLPPHLAESDYLAEFYGKVEWTVRSIFSGYLGWFDGDPASLLPDAPLDKARKMAALCGGTTELKNAMTTAFEDQDHQWALELSGYVLRLSPDDERVLHLRSSCLARLGITQSNPNARHYFLTQAKELKGMENESLILPGLEMVHSIPMQSIFNGMATFLNAEKAVNIEKSVVFQFTDTGEEYTLTVRRGVAEVQAYGISDPDHTLKVESTVWKEIAAELRKPLPAFVSGKIKVDGGKIAFMKFMDLFDR